MHRMRRIVRSALAAGALLSLVTIVTSSGAAERWVDRPMTQRRLVFAGDVGVGVGHVRVPALGPLADPATGLGMSFEGTLGVTDRLELGLRTGVRFGADGRATSPDFYGRTLTTETYGTSPLAPGGGDVANPELRLRWVAYSGSIAEVGLDGRVVLPTETGTRTGLMFGVPLALHISSLIRIDTGVFIPISLYDSMYNGLSIPGYVWFQASEKLWLGPMAQLRYINPPGPADGDTHLLLGFGLGYSLGSAVDLKTMLLFPSVDDDLVRRFGAGLGLQFRIGD